ncbi:hypothetical protein CBP51_03140 [Cellvibrio mixtus]|uniref:Uncharacterized protein n=1 Tax=Cellvibrio mixtus TaxID=39650 RepID=A0A266Q892_9GAMM|nr:hypothetical protein [Cellvibrio mixtus]OZY86040.1 hypothetical protein CBP51_03140 [Cellvibrio mixtus]
MSSNRFNKIIIIDSIPEGEENTAQNLYSAIALHLQTHSWPLAVEFKRVESANEFLQLFPEWIADVKKNDMYPMLHIECHGNEDGFEFADGSLLDWPELKAPLTSLNEAMCLNLMITVAACVGAAIAKVITMGDRAPFWGIIGPTKSVYPSQLEEPYKAMYLKLIETRSPVAAMEAFQEKAGDLYWRTTAQGLFQKGWLHYKNNYCDAATLEMRASRMHAQAPGLSKEVCLDRLQQHEPAAFERYKRTFFMFDLFPENEERFSVSCV